MEGGDRNIESECQWNSWPIPASVPLDYPLLTSAYSRYHTAGCARGRRAQFPIPEGEGRGSLMRKTERQAVSKAGRIQCAAGQVQEKEWGCLWEPSQVWFLGWMSAMWLTRPLEYWVLCKHYVLSFCSCGCLPGRTLCYTWAPHWIEGGDEKSSICRDCIRGQCLCIEHHLSSTFHQFCEGDTSVLHSKGKETKI